MGLRVWLPLNGDLHNQGCSPFTVTSIETTPTFTAGKIGQCYQRTNSNNQLTNGLRIEDNLIDLFGSTASIAVWVKPLNTHTHYNGTILSSGDWNKKKWAFGVSQDNTKVDVLCGSYNTYINCTVPVNEWTHLVSIYDNGTCTLYKNGVYIGQLTGQKAFETDATWTGICRETYASGYFGFCGCINDLRIYDHCLSAAEVREISQGLVLHYKLDGFQGGYGNPNLALGSQTLSTTATVSNTYISKRGAATLGTRDGFTQVNGTAAWQGFSLWSNSLNLQVGTTYTYSFYAYTALSTSTNAGISFYPMMYNSAGTRDTTSKLPISVMGGTFTEVNSKQIGILSTVPKLYWATFTWNQTMANILTNSGKIELSIQIHGTFNEGRIDYLWAPKLEIGNTPTDWSPAVSEGSFNIIQDSSGYNHNGTILNTVSISSDTPRYMNSIKLEAANSMINCGRGGMMTDSITVNFWLKSSSWANPVSCTEGGGWNFEAIGDYFRFPIYISGVGYKYGQSTTTKAQICNNQWHMLTGIYDRINQKVQIYVDGQLDNDYAAGTSNNIGYHGSNVIWIGAEATGSNTTASNGMAGLFSDFRIYCTALDADAIRQLYEVGAKVDNKNQLHSYELKEESPNIFFPIELSRTKLEFTNGLNKYTQANCQVTLTEQGYHIYRPPNLTTANDGNTMWGGLLINNQTIRTIAAYDATRDNIWGLQKGHTYIFAFHVKGQSTNSPSLIAESNMGWDRIAGVGPNPTYIATRTIPTDFNGEQDCYTIFTINDDIVKVATESKSSYVQGTSYLSYRELCLNYTYTSTGTLGTDIYLTNFRLYDITSHKAEITKMGQVDFSHFIEQIGNCKIRKQAEILASEFIEF